MSADVHYVIESLQEEVSESEEVYNHKFRCLQNEGYVIFFVIIEKRWVEN